MEPPARRPGRGRPRRRRHPPRPGGLAIDFLRVPEAKSVKNRLHLDLRSTDLAEATEQALALGATRADDIYDKGGWQVLRDPEGNEFCLLRPRR